jgi:hypothetical protein
MATKINTTFDELGKPIMLALVKTRTSAVMKKLLQLFLPIWEYYISYHLGRYRIYSEHADFPELHQEIYLYCIEVLKRVEGGKGNEFNRIKRYFNRSIQGWLINRIYTKQKRDIELTKDDVSLMMYPDQDNQYKVVELTTDLCTLEKHVDKEYGTYQELCGSLLGDVIYKEKKTYFNRFRKQVYDQYRETGKLLTAQEIFKTRFGVFAE